MIRKLFISILISFSLFGSAFGDDFGWVPNKEETEKFAKQIPVIYSQQVGELIAADDNEDRLLYRGLVPCLEKHGLSGWIKQRGEWKVVRAYNQGNVGSCVGNATAACLSVLNSLEVEILKEPQEFTAMHSADGTYGLCREAAGMLGQRGDGCYGSAAAKSILNLGTLYQLVYEDAKIDLRQNDPSRAKQYGYSGVGNALLIEAKKHKCMSAVRVQSSKEAWSLIGNGYPINVCSSQGFSNRRDSEGICQPSGSWNHSMAIIARRTTGDGKKLFLIWNSWGDSWASGPYWQDMPEGSFWVHWDVIDRMLSRGDSFAYGGLEGFRARDLDDLGAKEYLGLLKWQKGERDVVPAENCGGVGHLDARSGGDARRDVDRRSAEAGGSLATTSASSRNVYSTTSTGNAHAVGWSGDYGNEVWLRATAGNPTFSIGLPASTSP